MVWNKDTPRNQDQGRDATSDFTANWSAIEDTFSTDHNKPDSTDEGEHKQITFFGALEEDPTSEANKAFLYTKQTSSEQEDESDAEDNPELYWMDEDGNIVQMTEGGRLTPRSLWIQKNTTGNESNGPIEITTVPSSSPNMITMERKSRGVYLITIPEQAENFFTYAFNSIGDQKRECRIVRESIQAEGTTVDDETNTYIRINIFDSIGDGKDSNFVFQIRHAQ